MELCIRNYLPCGKKFPTNPRSRQKARAQSWRNRRVTSLRGRRKKGRGRGEGEREKGRERNPQSPSPFSLPPYLLPLSTPATQAKELHIKKTDKLSAIKTILDKLVIKQTRVRSIYNQLCSYPAAVSNATDQTGVQRNKVRKADTKKDGNYGKLSFTMVKKAEV